MRPHSNITEEGRKRQSLFLCFLAFLYSKKNGTITYALLSLRINVALPKLTELGMFAVQNIITASRQDKICTLSFIYISCLEVGLEILIRNI